MDVAIGSEIINMFEHIFAQRLQEDVAIGNDIINMYNKVAT